MPAWLPPKGLPISSALGGPALDYAERWCFVLDVSPPDIPAWTYIADAIISSPSPRLAISFALFFDSTNRTAVDTAAWDLYNRVEESPASSDLDALFTATSFLSDGSWYEITQPSSEHYRARFTLTGHGENAVPLRPTLVVRWQPAGDVEIPPEEREALFSRCSLHRSLISGP